MPLKLYEKEKILDACFDVFVKNGYDQTSTLMLAEAAGISKALIFHHFGSKKKLYISILERCFDKMAPELNKLTKNECNDFFDAKDQNSRNTIAYMRKNPETNSIFFEAFYATPHDLKNEILQFHARMKEKYGAMNAENEKRMLKLFSELPFKENIKGDEAYELVQIVSEHFRKKLAAELTDPEKLHNDGYWQSFFEKKNSFLEMVRFGIEEQR